MDERPDELVVVRTMANEFAAGIIVAQLEDEGIEASMSAGDSHSLGVFGSTGLAPTAVWVRRDVLEEAESALERLREASLDIDWSEVDVGEPDADDRLAQRIAGGRSGVGIFVQARTEVLVLLIAGLVLGMLMVWPGTLVCLVLAVVAALRGGMRASAGATGAEDGGRGREDTPD